MAKERPPIYEHLVASEEMVEYARVLRSVAKGGSNVVETADWTVQSFPHAQYAADCVFHPDGTEQAVFSFVMAERSQQIEMENTHRRARGGCGVSAFSHLEHMAAALSRMENKPVRMTYPLYGQKDTEQFLLRRGYNTVLYFPMGSLVPARALAWTYDE
ncbi:MAG: hypothetical protein ACOY3M_06840 [Patescibacteria group bacterium]